MTNPFDLGGYDSQDMGGLFSKLKKAVKKVGKTVKKSVKSTAKAVKGTIKKPLDPKSHVKVVKTQAKNVKANIRAADSVARAVQSTLTPKFIENIRKKVSGELRKSPIATAVVMVAASFLIGPAVAAIASKMGAVSANLIKGATAIAKAASNDMIKASHTKAITADAKKKLDLQMGKMSQMIGDLSKDKDFQKTVATMKAQGKSDADIIIAWANSKTAVTVAENQVAALLLPEITQRLKADKSVPSKDVPTIAAATAKSMAVDLVKQARNTQVNNLVASDRNTPIAVTQNTAVKSVTPLPPTQPVSPLLPIAAIAASLLM